MMNTQIALQIYLEGLKALYSDSELTAYVSWMPSYPALEFHVSIW